MTRAGNVTLLMLLVAATVSSLPCDATYYMQSAMQYLKTGTAPTTSETVETTTVHAGLRELAILDNNITYRVLWGFEGACDFTRKALIYKVRTASAPAFASQTDTSMLVRLFDGIQTPLAGTAFDLWFGWRNPTDSTLRMAVGRNGEGKPYYLWQYIMRLTDSTKASSGLWSTQVSFSTATFHDSSALEQVARSYLSDTSFNGITRKARYQLQLIRIDYDTTAPTVSVAPVQAQSRIQPTGGRIAAIASGSVLLAPAALGRTPLRVCDAAGRVVATGWLSDGRCRLSASLPAGSYVARAGLMNLGAFVVR